MDKLTLPLQAPGVDAIQNFVAQYWWLVVILMLWSIIWKGIALWKSARNESKVWFVILLIVNTVGILEIIYIYAVAGRKDKAIAAPQV
jgi:methionyl-tRNA synthetase